MVTVGVRELRQRASDLLRLVAGGESVQITDRGRPVAMLTKLPDAPGIDYLRTTGELEPPEQDFDGLPEPLPLRPGRTPSEVLADLRRDER